MTNPLRLSAFTCLVAIAGVAGVGCASDPAGQDDDAEAYDADVTGMRYYDCRGSSDNGDTMARFELALGADKAKVTDISKDAAEPDTGSLDPSYKPTAETYKGSSRFVGFDKVVRGMSGDVSRIDVMVSEELQKHRAKGRVWVRFSGGEGASTSSYSCSSKSKALAVDTAVKARWICDPAPLLCGAGAPPGQTCLGDLFVQQATGGATLRLNWLDHFGVHVAERKEAVGDATTFTRSKSSVKGKWGDHALFASGAFGLAKLLV